MSGIHNLAHLRLLGVVGPPVVRVESIVDSSLAAEAGGMTALQVRWKNGTAAELVELTERLVGALSIPVYVNDRADVAWAAGAAGVHLGADDLDPNSVRAVSPSGFLIGASVGTAEEAERTLAAQVDYWSVGAIYHTGTKPDAGAPIGVSGFKRLSALAPANMPVIAIGGIDSSNVTDVLQAGAVGVAAITSVFGSGDVEQNATMLRSTIDEALSL